MSERRHILRPLVEPFESRALLSGAIGALPVAAAVAADTTVRIVHLNGTIRGHYHVNVSIPDVGSTYVTNGSGHVHGVGHTFLTGKLHSIGFIARGHAQGELFLAGANGTITLELTGAEQDNGPKGLPDVFSYTTAGGTGKYTNVQDSGIATLVTIPSHTQTTLQSLEHGKFTLVLTSQS
jgi:hypothetical protein